VSISPAKNLNPLHPGYGIAEKKLPHADLILPRPWNQVEKGGFDELRVWEGVELGRGRAEDDEDD